LEQEDLNIYFDEKFFDDLQKGNIKIKKYGNIYIFEQKDKSAMMVNEN
jgi:hypothetical protein